MDTSTEKENIISEEGIKNITAFSSTLGRIHARMISQGYVIKNGKVYKPQ
jgi:hypothetical protein